MPDQTPAHVLLVEDVPDQAVLTEIALRRAGYRKGVTQVSDGDAAIAYLAARPPYADRAIHPRPALVLLDLEMPNVSGEEVLAWLRADERPEWLQELPVVVVTGIDDQERLRRVRELGAEGVVEKVPNPRQLSDKLREHCGPFLGMGGGEANSMNGAPRVS